MGVKCVLITMVVLFAVGMLADLSHAKIDPKTCVGMWLFDEGSGTTGKDSSGNKNDGTLKNGTKWVDGKFGKALSFNGVDDYVDCGSGASLDITDAITVGAWVNIPNVSGLKTIIGKQGAYAFNIRDNEIRFTLPALWDADTSGAALTSGSWSHIAITYDKKNVKYYKDGVFIFSIPETDAIRVTANTLLIGNNEWNEWFSGTMDEVVLFNVVLTEDDIKDIMKGGSNVLAVSPSGKLAATWASIKAR
ncbi:MAG: LamG domain-containing protein [Chloroflexi bacterium]|nr:LamG domain-containing protein [Chloroflexota bacterium]